MDSLLNFRNRCFYFLDEEQNLLPGKVKQIFSVFLSGGKRIVHIAAAT